MVLVCWMNPVAECLDFWSLAGGFGGDQAAALGCVVLVLDGGHEGAVLEFAGYQAVRPMAAPTPWVAASIRML